MKTTFCDITSRIWCVDDVLCKMVSGARKALFCGRGFNPLVDELKALWHSSQTVVWDPTQIVLNSKCIPPPTTTTIIIWCVGWYGLVDLRECTKNLFSFAWVCEIRKKLLGTMINWHRHFESSSWNWYCNAV